MRRRSLTARAIRPAIAVAAIRLLAACGAKTGLEIETFDAAFDAAIDAPIDVGTDAPDAPVCRPGVFPVEPTRADVMLVLDRSGSMRLDFAGTETTTRSAWRWSFLRSAIERTLSSLDDRVRIGTKIYPDPIPPGLPSVPASVACRVSSGVDVPPGLGTTRAILGAMDVTDPLGGTPTVDAILEARTALASSSLGRRFIVVATDGGPNCNPRTPADPRTCLCTSVRESCTAPSEGIYSCVDDPRTTEVLDETNLRYGIPVFVIGIPDESRPDLTDYIDRMAVAGGRPRTLPGERSFYSARSPTELQEAFDAITDSISRCAYVSTPILGGDEHLFVELDGERLTQSPIDGWTWSSREHGEFELHGDACERADRPDAELHLVIDDCPDL